MKYAIHGGMNTFNGDIDWLEAHGGVLYVNGNVTKLVQHGGVIYDQRPANRVEFKMDVFDEEDRRQYIQRIQDLERKLMKSQNECLRLQSKLNESGESIPDDDVLIARIELLQSKLEKERAERKREVEDLKERIDVAMEVNARLRRDTCRDLISENIADKHVDILASLMALYPFTPDKDLVLEFNIPADRIREVARVLNVTKSPDARREAVEYLRKQHIEFIQRRGGDRSKSNKKAGKNKTKKK